MKLNIYRNMGRNQNPAKRNKVDPERQNPRVIFLSYVELIFKIVCMCLCVCVSLVSIPVVKHHDQKQPEEERVYVANTPIS